MPKVIMDALAETTAHGISRIATTRSRTMKVMWCLLFLFFLAMFCRTSVMLVARLRDNALAKSFEIDKVPFVFPDLYFCPSNPYSGSFPYALSPGEAHTINSAVANLSAEFDTRYGSRTEMGLRTRLVQNSLPVHLSFELLAHRSSETVQQRSATPTMGPPPRFIMMPRVLPFSHPENLICFKLNLTDYQRQKIVTDNWQVNLRLSTDPYFAEFNYSGRGVDPIRDPTTGAEVPLQDWSVRDGSERLQETGFTMLIVPVGSYPSFSHESKFQLAPSNSYSVALSMEETIFSEELHGEYCQADHGTVDFVDHLTGRPQSFSYSQAACYYENLVQLLAEQYGCLVASFPLVWKLRSTPRCLNMSQTSKEGLDKVQQSRTDWRELDRQVQAVCRAQQPCCFQQYSASFSFSRWPSVGSSIVQHFAEKKYVVTPATRRLTEMAKALRDGNHTAHMEASFRAYLSESLISIRIMAQRTTSPQVVISPAYSVTAFLADTGGLLGLYIGCSLLTVCELLELMYRLLSDAVLKLHRRRESAKAHDDAMEEAGVDGAESLRADGHELENAANKV